MKLSKEKLDELITEIVNNELNNNNKFIKINNQKTRTHMKETITPKDFESLKRKVVSILQNMEPEMRREHLEDITGRFGFMSFQRFLAIQNKMVDSAEGKLDDPKN